MGWSNTSPRSIVGWRAVVRVLLRNTHWFLTQPLTHAPPLPFICLLSPRSLLLRPFHCII
ncbi:hypothetical protein BD413DRAFT_570111, partial [Trametes elegans]